MCFEKRVIDDELIIDDEYCNNMLDWSHVTDENINLYINKQNDQKVKTGTIRFCLLWQQYNIHERMNQKISNTRANKKSKNGVTTYHNVTSIDELLHAGIFKFLEERQ